MSATYAGVTPSLPSYNPNASRTDERPIQLTWSDGHMTWTDGHVDNPVVQHFYNSVAFLVLCPMHSQKNLDVKIMLLVHGPGTSIPRSWDIYSTIIGRFYFIHFNIFFLINSDS